MYALEGYMIKAKDHSGDSRADNFRKYLNAEFGKEGQQYRDQFDKLDDSRIMAALYLIQSMYSLNSDTDVMELLSAPHRVGANKQILDRILSGITPENMDRAVKYADSRFENPADRPSNFLPKLFGQIVNLPITFSLSAIYDIIISIKNKALAEGVSDIQQLYGVIRSLAPGKVQSPTYRTSSPVYQALQVPLLAPATPLATLQPQFTQSYSPQSYPPQSYPPQSYPPQSYPQSYSPQNYMQPVTQSAPQTYVSPQLLPQPATQSAPQAYMSPYQSPAYSSYSSYSYPQQTNLSAVPFQQSAPKSGYSLWNSFAAK